MKIAFLLHDYLPEHVGGTEVHVHGMAKAMQARGHEVLVLCSERDLTREAGALLEREHEGVRVLEVMHPREWGSRRESWEEPRALAVFEELMASERPEVLHVHHTLFWGVACLQAARRHGARVFFTAHDYHALCARNILWDEEHGACLPEAATSCAFCLDPWPAAPGEGADNRARFEYFREGLRAAECVLTPSATLADALERSGMVEASRLHPFELGLAGEMRPVRRPASGRGLRIGYLGGLFAAKGAHVLIEAARRLEGRDYELHLHGPLEWFPDYVAGLRHRAGRMPVNFHGRYAPHEVEQVLASLDLLVVPSLWPENRPLVLLEAWRSGLAVVASDLGGLAECVRPGRGGLLFPPGDVEALAATLSDLIASPERVEAIARGRPSVKPLNQAAGELERVFQS